jgi:hypothetical protein
MSLGSRRKRSTFLRSEKDASLQSVLHVVDSFGGLHWFGD